MLNDFKKFLLRGNMVDMAIAVVIGVALGAVIKATVENLITPLIGIFGKKDFSAFTFAVLGSTFRYGDWINAVVAFITVAAVLFLFVVLPMNKLIERSRKGPPAAPPRANARNASVKSSLPRTGASTAPHPSLPPSPRSGTTGTRSCPHWAQASRGRTPSATMAAS